ncbi:hypothetical protein EV1_036021 [Malus domestica]
MPFALAAGLSGTNATSSIVLTAGIAEVTTGAISMGLDGYLAAKSESDHYIRELRREQEEIIKLPLSLSLTLALIRLLSFVVSVELLLAVARVSCSLPTLIEAATAEHRSGGKGNFSTCRRSISSEDPIS